MTITMVISIVNDGVGVAGIKASWGNAITINAGVSDSVHLRGLTIAGLSGANGILFNTGGNFAIENCVIRNFSNAGINIAPTRTAVVTGVLSKVITNNNASGISVNGGATTGVLLDVTVVDSVVSNNGGSGVVAVSGAGKAATAVMVRNSVASNNDTGFFARNAILRAGHSVVTGNTTGVSVGSGGTLFSYRDNDIDGNTNDNTGVLTPLAKH